MVLSICDIMVLVNFGDVMGGWIVLKIINANQNQNCRLLMGGTSTTTGEMIS